MILKINKEAIMVYTAQRKIHLTFSNFGQHELLKLFRRKYGQRYSVCTDNDYSVFSGHEHMVLTCLMTGWYNCLSAGTAPPAVTGSYVIDQELNLAYRF